MSDRELVALMAAVIYSAHAVGFANGGNEAPDEEAAVARAMAILHVVETGRAP